MMMIVVVVVVAPQKSRFRCHFPPTCLADGTGSDGLIAEEELREVNASVGGNCSRLFGYLRD